jgi:hypothetical protein
LLSFIPRYADYDPFHADLMAVAFNGPGGSPDYAGLQVGEREERLTRRETGSEEKASYAVHALCMSNRSSNPFHGLHISLCA